MRRGSSTHFFALLCATLGFAAIVIDNRYTCDLVGHGGDVSQRVALAPTLCGSVLESLTLSEIPRGSDPPRPPNTVPPIGSETAAVITFK